MTTREEAIQAAGLVFALARIQRDSLTPRAAAEAAYYVGHRLGSVDAIEALIIRQRQDALVQAELAEQHPLAA